MLSFMRAKANDGNIADALKTLEGVAEACDNPPHLLLPDSTAICLESIAKDFVAQDEKTLFAPGFRQRLVRLGCSKFTDNLGQLRCLDEGQPNKSLFDKVFHQTCGRQINNLRSAVIPREAIISREDLLLVGSPACQRVVRDDMGYKDKRYRFEDSFSETSMDRPDCDAVFVDASYGDQFQCTHRIECLKDYYEKTFYPSYKLQAIRGTNCYQAAFEYADEHPEPSTPDCEQTTLYALGLMQAACGAKLLKQEKCLLDVFHELMSGSMRDDEDEFGSVQQRPSSHYLNSLFYQIRLQCSEHKGFLSSDECHRKALAELIADPASVHTKCERFKREEEKNAKVEQSRQSKSVEKGEREKRRGDKGSRASKEERVR
jgi:hypothetical protein